MQLTRSLEALLHPSREGELGGEETRLFLVRMWCAIAALLVMGFGLVYQYTDPDAFDPLWGRALAAAVPLGALALSYMSSAVRRHFSSVGFGLIYFFLIWFIGLTALNQFAPNYAIGLFFAFAALGVIHSLSLGNYWPLINFLVFGVLLSSGAHLAVPDPGVSWLIFTASIFSTGVVLYVALRARILAEKSLIESEERNRAILRQTSEGIFLVDAETLRFIEANPAYCKLVGYTEEELRAMKLYEVTASSRERIEQRLESIYHGEPFLIEETQHYRKDSAPVDVEVSVSRITNAGKEMLCAVVHDVRARKRTEQALREAKERAEEMLQTKTALLNNMSHELRTPLTGILGFAEVLVEEADSTEQEDFARLIAQSGKRLLGTLEAVMKLAELESGKVDLSEERVDLVQEAKRAAEAFGEKAQAKGLSIEVRSSEPALNALVDPKSLQRVLRHLIDNAIKFTEEGGIRIEVEARDGEAVMRVTDTGVGITESFLPQLFDEFKQESSGLARSHEGVGLGLTITQRLVMLMGGEIEVESTHGKGSTFTVRLPQPVQEEQPTC